MYKKYKELASGYVDPHSGNYSTEFIGYVPYVVVLVLSTIVAFMLLIVIINVIIPVWIFMFKNRNNHVGAFIVDGDERLLNDDLRR